MIASPSDIVDARDAVEQAIHGWNRANSTSKLIVLLPWRWETSAVPILGGHPQKLINAQGVDDSDIVFALFGGRLGSPTPDAVSGTAEEIDRAQKLGKPVHLYFSTAPLPHDIDTEQLAALRAFKRDMQDKGLLGEFSDLEHLSFEVWKAIEHDLAGRVPNDENTPETTTGVRLVVQPGSEREVSGFDRKGKPRYRTRRWVDISNRGNVDATDVTMQSVGEASGLLLMAPNTPTVINAGQSRRFAMGLAWGGPDDPKILLRWVDQGEHKKHEYHVG